MPTAIGAQDQGKATEPAPEFPTMLHSGSSKNAAAPSTPTQTTTVDNKLTAAQEQELEFYRLMAEADAYVDGALMPTSLSKVVGDEHTISGTHSANGRSALSRSMDLLLRPRALPNVCRV